MSLVDKPRRFAKWYLPTNSKYDYLNPPTECKMSSVPERHKKFYREKMLINITKYQLYHIYTINRISTNYPLQPFINATIVMLALALK